MSKTLETKDKILKMLKAEKKTVSELSVELGLSKATISQHLQELKGIGVVEEADNHYFRRLKYYQIRPGTEISSGRAVAGSSILKAALGLFIAIIAFGSLYLYLQPQP